MEESTTNSFELEPRIVKFLQRLLDERPTERRSPGIAGHIAAKLQIGRGDVSMIRYTDADFASARALLTKHGHATHLPAVQAPEKPQARVDTADLVAVNFVNMPQYGDSRLEFSAMTRMKAQDVDCDVIVLCCSFNSLTAMRSLGWVEKALGGRRAMGIYVGTHAVLFSRAAADRLVRAMRAPVLRLGPFTPVALLSAARTPRLAGVLLPPREQLALALRGGRKIAWNVHQVQQARFALDEVANPLIAEPWQLMRQARTSMSFGDLTAVGTNWPPFET